MMPGSVRGFVVAGVAAGFAVHEAVSADADVELRLAKTAEPFALALVFSHFALAAAVFGVPGSSGHNNNIGPLERTGNVP
jgi:hypothetical protein